MLENNFANTFWSVFSVTDINDELLSPCGLYCGVCRIYLAHKDNDIEFKKEILPTLNSIGIRNVDDVACRGCLSDEVVFNFCRTCPIKDCIKNKEINGCYLCEEFPCKIIRNWPDLLEKKIILRSTYSRQKLGTERWVEAEKKRYKCPKCGNPLFHGAKKCKRCNLAVDLD
ncbi:MAG: DUF3795 domain-containing protein [Candidatus Heimdallarchaeota archaeon]